MEEVRLSESHEEVIQDCVLWKSIYSGWHLVSPNGETIESFGESRPTNEQVQSIIAAWEFVSPSLTKEFAGCLA